jgi:hypothetical protein
MERFENRVLKYVCKKPESDYFSLVQKISDRFV